MKLAPRIREMLEILLRHLDPTGPSTELDRAVMSQYLRFFLKNGDDGGIRPWVMRPHLRAFGEAVEKTLQNNAWKGKWEEYSFEDAKAIVLEELEELREAFEIGDAAHTRIELRDVAAACMIAWSLLPPEEDDGPRTRH